MDCSKKDRSIRDVSIEQAKSVPDADREHQRGNHWSTLCQLGSAIHAYADTMTESRACQSQRPFGTRIAMFPLQCCSNPWDHGRINALSIEHAVAPQTVSEKGWCIMLSWALTFLVIALIAAALGFGGLAGTASSIAQVLFFVFLVLFLISLIAPRFRPPVA
jgi:uncharacterized membrane protein YtjA (UPF0391 family)